jgi:proteasome accessory factor C
MEILQENENQYVRAFCFSAGAMRDFRVDRIIEATQISERPVGIEATVTSKSIDFTISLMKPSRDVVERFDVKYSDISKSLKLQSFSQQWIERSVMASGDGVELASPLNIRADIASKAQLILDRYKAI